MKLKTYILLPVTIILALVTGVAASGQQTSSEEDLKRRVEDQKKVIEEFSNPFELRPDFSPHQYYWEFYNELKALKRPLPGSSDWSPPAVTYNDDVAHTLQGRRDDIRDFSPKAKEKAYEMNHAVKRYLREVELLSSVAPNATIPAVSVDFHSSLQRWKEALVYFVETTLPGRNAAYRQWKQEFDNLIAQSSEFNSDLATHLLVLRYIDEFNKLGLDESPSKYTRSEEYSSLRHIVIKNTGQMPPLLVLLSRVHWRWRHFEIERDAHLIVRDHLKEVQEMLSILDNGLDVSVWDRLAHPPLPGPRKIVLNVNLISSGNEPLPVPPSGFDIIVGPTTFKSSGVNAGPFEIETASGMPDVSARFEYKGTVYAPSRVRVEQDGPDQNQFIAMLYFDLSAVQSSIWTLSGQVIEKSSGKPISGAKVGVREKSFITSTTGEFGPVEIPAEIESVAITVSVSAQGPMAGASAGARRPAEGRAYVQIPVELTKQDGGHASLSFGKAFLDPSKPAYDVGDEFNIIISYHIESLPENRDVILTRKLRITGKFTGYPGEGDWSSDQVTAQESEVYSHSFQVPPDFMSGDYSIEVSFEAQGITIDSPPALTFHVSGLYAGAVYMLHEGLDLIEQCKPIDAYDLLIQVPAAIRSKTSSLYADLQYKASAASERAQIIAGQMAAGFEKLALAKGSDCMPNDTKKVLDTLRLEGLPDACARRLGEKAAQMRAQADERIAAVALMKQKLAAGKAKHKACRFSEAIEAFSDPVFSSNTGCEEESKLASEAASLAGESKKSEDILQSLEEKLRKAEDSISTGKPQDAVKLVGQVIADIDNNPLRSCYSEQHARAEALLLPPSPGRAPAVSVTIIGPDQVLQGRQIILGSEITVDGTPVNDPETYNYSWETPDGKSVTGKRSVSFAPRSPGQIMVRLTVADPQGRSASVSKAITVPKHLQASIAADKTEALPGEKVTFSVSLSDESELCPCTFKWQAAGVSQTFTSKTVWFKYSKPGNYTVSLDVQDSFGQTAAASYTMAVKEGAGNQGGGTPPKENEGTLTGEQGSKPVNPFCDSYAKTAVAQYQENLSRNCGYSDRRWQNSYENHYGWCTTVNKKSADYETSARDKGLQQCTSKAPL